MSLALASGAQAYCFPVPDLADTSYVTNDLKRTLWDNELTQSTNQQLLNNQIDATLNQLQRHLQQQKFMLQQLQAQSALTTP